MAEERGQGGKANDFLQRNDAQCITITTQQAIFTMMQTERTITLT
jgi:hypothetical protein